MQKISEQMRIALRALKRMSVSEPISGRSLATEASSSEFFLSQTMAKLAKAGLVYARRGPGGGYLLKERSLDAYDVACALGYKEILTVEGIGEDEIDNQLSRNIVQAYKSVVIR